MLTIKHDTGPLQGTQTEIASNVGRVVFGRQVDCDVVYPAEATIVARRHFALVREPSGSWTIDLFGGPVVAIDGKAAEEGQHLRNGARIELGKLGGPAFTVLLERTTTDNYPVTEQQIPLPGARAVAEQARAGASRARTVGVGAAVVAVAAIAFGASQYFSSRSSFAQLNDAVARSGEAQRQLAEVSIGKPVRDKLARSVYQVVTQVPNGGFTGTAWPVGPHLLATNAHVAADAKKPGASTTVQEPGAGGKRYTVTKVRMHPGFDAFESFLKQDIIILKLPGGGIMPAGLNVAGYDVALLEIKETLPADQIFTLAAPAQYNALQTGQPLATAGYPGEGFVGGGAAQIRSTPEFHTGSVTGLTDFFFLPADPAHRQLIHDDLPIAGGASGSPVVDNTGKVVGLASAGNMFKVKEMNTRMPSAALVNYAQRVDMLQTLLDNREDAELAEDRPYWQAQAANFVRGLALIVDKLVEEAVPGASRSQVLDKTVTTSASDRQPKKSGGTQRETMTPFTVDAGTRHVFVAYGLKQAPLQLYVLEGDKVVASDKTAWFPNVKLDAAPAARKLSLVVVSDDADVTYVVRAYKVEDKPKS